MQGASVFGGSDRLSELPILLAIVQELGMPWLPCLAVRLTTTAYRRSRARGPWRFLEHGRNPMVFHLDAVGRNTGENPPEEFSRKGIG